MWHNTQPTCCTCCMLYKLRFACASCKILQTWKRPPGSNHKHHSKQRTNFMFLMVVGNLHTWVVNGMHEAREQLNENIQMRTIHIVYKSIASLKSLPKLSKYSFRNQKSSFWSQIDNDRELIYSKTSVDWIEWSGVWPYFPGRLAGVRVEEVCASWILIVCLLPLFQDSLLTHAEKNNLLALHQD